MANGCQDNVLESQLTDRRWLHTQGKKGVEGKREARKVRKADLEENIYMMQPNRFITKG